MLNLDTIRPGQTITLDYARRTKSGLSSRIGEVVEIRPTYVRIKEAISPTEHQFRCFTRSAILNASVLID